MYYYTYYSYEEFGRGYIGSRQCKVPPEQDVKYFGSFKDKTFKPTQKIILASHYKTREEAIDDEIRIQRFFQVVPNLHFANRSYQTSNKFIVEGEYASKIQREKWAKYTPEQRSQMAKKRDENLTPEQRSQRTKLGWNQTSQEERSKRAKQRSMGLTTEQRRNISRNTMMNLPTERRVNNARKAGLKGGVVTSSQKWQCTETGYVSNAGVLTLYQRKRGIDTSKRIKLS
jgi:hypothetical protein